MHGKKSPAGQPPVTVMVGKGVGVGSRVGGFNWVGRGVGGGAFKGGAGVGTGEGSTAPTSDGAQMRKRSIEKKRSVVPLRNDDLLEAPLLWCGYLVRS